MAKSSRDPIRARGDRVQGAKPLQAINAAAALLVVYVGVAIASRIYHGAHEHPWWMLCLALAAGSGVAVLISLRSNEPSGSGWALLLTCLTGLQLLVLFLGALFVGFGVCALVTGKMLVKGRTGPMRTERGASARVWGSAYIILGGAVVGWALAGRPM